MQTYPKRPGQPSPELTQGHESQHAPPSPSHPILSPLPPPRFNSLQQISTEAHSGLVGAWPTQRLWASELMQVREAQPPCPSCSSPPTFLHLLRSDCEHHTEEGRRAFSGEFTCVLCGSAPCRVHTHVPGRRASIQFSSSCDEHQREQTSMCM